MTLNAERLREVLDYDQETGRFTRKSNGNSKFSANVPGYTQIGIDGKMYTGHRLAWLYVYGQWPKDQIDHINGVRTDNRISNLRECSQEQNTHNAGLRKDNKAGLKGAFPFRNKWTAQICRRGVKRHLGVFETAEEAHAAYCVAARQTFGEFSRTS